jgi:hypothetical protein
VHLKAAAELATSKYSTIASAIFPTGVLHHQVEV